MNGKNSGGGGEEEKDGAHTLQSYFERSAQGRQQTMMPVPVSSLVIKKTPTLNKTDDLGGKEKKKVNE